MTVRLMMLVYFLGVAVQPAFADNAAMTAIFDQDQQVRQSGDWPDAGDKVRRVQTKQLLDSGAISTGKDFEHAAFVFQHGEVPDDFLLAHVLATIAVAKGEQEASWIAAATLDRYLQRIGQKQILGTQYQKLTPNGVLAGDGQWTQEPYNRALVSDDLRRAFGVPSLEKQAEQLRAMRAQK